MRTRAIWLLQAALAAGILTTWTGRARAQAAGEIVLTQTEVPTDLSGRALRKFLARNRVRVLKRPEGASGWDVWVVAKLRRQPSKSLLNLPANAGKLHLVFYERRKRRWVYVNVMNINYAPAKVLIFQVKIPDDLGLVPGKPYQMRLTLLNARNKEIIFAKTNFKLK